MTETALNTTGNQAPKLPAFQNRVLQALWDMGEGGCAGDVAGWMKDVQPKYVQLALRELTKQGEVKSVRSLHAEDAPNPHSDLYTYYTVNTDK